MEITRKSAITGIIRTLEIDITEDQLRRWLNKEGLIQHIMPNISDDEREFIMTGITAEEWDNAFEDRNTIV